MKNFINKYFYKKSGFTIPEILIVLVLVGVIASMTMPTLINNYGEHERISKISKVYSIFTNAIENYVIKGEDYTYYVVENSTDGMKDFYDKFLKNSLNVMQECLSNEKDCWSESDTKKMNGDKVDFGDSTIGFTLIDGTFVKLVNLDKAKFSALFGVTKEESEGLAVVFDINGVKVPNVVGKDVFAMVFTTDDGIIPPFKDADDTTIENDCSNTGSGFSCVKKYVQTDVSSEE